MTTLGIILMQAITMFQPKAIIATGGGGDIVAVELGQTETRVHLQRDMNDDAWQVPLTTYLSDEADMHHALLRFEAQDEKFVLVFDALPTTTRVFDLIGDERHRWMGVHSGVRSLHIPRVRPVYNAEAEIPDSIGEIIRENSLTETLRNDSVYATMSSCLPLLRDYVVWKWKLTPHEAFVLRRELERPMPIMTEMATTTTQPPTNRIHIFDNSRMPQPRQSFFKRLFSKKKKEGTPSGANAHKPRPLSRFEQKMLQERRVK